MRILSADFYRPRARLVALLGFLLLPVVAVPQQQPPSKGRVSGVVLRADTGEPIAGANVQIAFPSNLLLDFFTRGGTGALPPQVQPVTTDAQGRFVFENLAASPYQITANATGYLFQEYGASRSGPLSRGIGMGMGKVLEVGPNTSIDGLTLRMQRGATVSGRVTSNGQPVIGMAVILVRPAYTSDGRRVSAQGGVATTDDRGEYRIFNVTPGPYYLEVEMATYVTRGNMSERELYSLGPTNRKYSTVYYPSEKDPARASMIEIKADSELKGLDFVLSPAPTYRIRGRIVDAATGQVPAGRLNLAWYRRDSILAPTSSGSDNSTTIKPDGTFESQEVHAGKYWVTATLQPAIQPQRGGGANLAALSAFTSQAVVAVEIVSGNIENLVIAMHPRVSLTTHLSVEGQALSTLPGFERIVVGVQPPIVGSISLISPPRFPGPIPADGVITFEGVQPADYRLNVARLPDGVYVKEALLGSDDVLNNGLHVRETPETLNIVLSTKAGEVEGTITDEQRKPVEAAQAVLVPQSRTRLDLYRSIASDSAGHFEMKAIPPGDYQLFAWDDIDGFPYYDENFLKRFESTATTIHVEESAKSAVTVQVSSVKP